jgi:hypothetical protein
MSLIMPSSEDSHPNSFPEQNESEKIQTRRQKKPLPKLALATILFLTLLRPGDTSWVNDEPILMEMAIRYNKTASQLYGFYLPFTPSPFGLQGTRGARYGPFPVWFDQILLAFTHNAILITACRAFLFTALTTIALYWLAKTLRVSPWFAVVTMLSPWLYTLSRSLWDSSWCIPISALLFASYAAFLQKPRGVLLNLVLICLFLLPTIHLMALAIVTPIAIHLALFHRHQLWQEKWKIATILLFFAYLFWPYLAYVVSHDRTNVHTQPSTISGWLFPLVGGQYLTLGVPGTMPGEGWNYFAPHAVTIVFKLAQWISRAALLAVWAGMILAIPRALRSISPSAISPRETSSRKKTSPADHLCLIALAVWLCQTILDGLEHVYFGPQYSAATWIVYTFFAWLTIDCLLTHRPKIATITRASLAVYSASLIAGLLMITTSIAQNGGTLSPYYGTSLRCQIDAVKKIQELSDPQNVNVQIPQWQQHPIAYQVLCELNPLSPSPRPPQPVTAKYRNAHPGDSTIEIAPN